MSAITHRRRTPSDDLLASYLEEIAAFPLLSRRQEADLARRIQSGDAEATRQLVCANLRFVVSIAKKYQTRGVPLIDLINEGNIGLMEAAEKFDARHGVKFISYAVWYVRQMIFQALAEQGHAVRVPVGRAAMLFRLAREKEALRQTLGREPAREELTVGASISDDELTDALSLLRAPLSLDAAFADDRDATLLDRVSGDGVPADEQLSHAAVGESVELALTQLSVREAQVIRSYFGLEGEEPMTLERIGDEMHVTRERARQIKERALRKLRRSVHRETLAALHE